MKKILLFVLLACCAFLLHINDVAAAGVTISTVATPAGNMNQGSNSNIIYIARLDVTGSNVTISNVQFTLGGNYDNTDLGNISIYTNASAPTIAGASLANNAAAGFSGPHSFSIGASFIGTAGGSLYVIITANVTAAANDNHTVGIDGAVNPLVFTFSVVPVITNNQTNAAGVQTIQASDVTISSISLPAGNINQGSNTNIVYIAKIDVGTEPININGIVFNLTGTYDNTDLSNLGIFFNATAPTIAGASLGNNTPGNFAGPHTFNVGANWLVSAGASVYIIVTANITATATDNHTLIVNGALDPLTLSTTTAPNFTNNQTNAAGIQTIQAADVSFTSIAVPAANINQGSNTNIIYIAKVDVATEPININGIIFNLTGTYSNTDLSNLSVYFNATAPTIAGASVGNNAPANFAGPHVFTVGINWLVNAGASVYIIITANINSSATDNHTLTVNGATDPIILTTTTAPNFTNNQTNAAGVQTIQASDLAISTVTTPAGNLNPGTPSNIIYIAKMDAGTAPITVSNILITLNGTYDNDDLSSLSVYYNTTAPTLAGASVGNNASAAFAGPHAFNIPASTHINAGSSVYVIITVNIAPSATDNHTIFVDGAANPLMVTATTIPNIANNQTNTAGVQTIRASDIIMSTVTLPAANIVPGANNNIIYALKMDVGTQPVTVNNVQVTLLGNYDNDDLGNLAIYYNANTPSLSGASLMNNVAAANTTGPHTFSVGASVNIAAGTVGYIVFALNVNSGATINNTVSVNGATNPVLLGYTTAPNIADNQSNAAGIFYFATAALPLTLTSFTAAKIPGNQQALLQWVTASETGTKNFEVQWSTGAVSYASAGTIVAQGNSQVDKHYSFVHNGPVNGMNYYRLKMIDTDGRFTYSPVVSVKITGVVNHTTIAPNPVTSSLRIVTGNTDLIKSLRIYDMTGRVVWQTGSIVNTGIIFIPFAAFGSGVYTAAVTTQNGVERLSFIKAAK